MTSVGTCMWGVRNIEGIVQYGETWSRGANILALAACIKAVTLFPLQRRAGPIPRACETFLAHITDLLLSSHVPSICEEATCQTSTPLDTAGKRSVCICVCRSPGALSSCALFSTACERDREAERVTCIAGEMGRRERAILQDGKQKQQGSTGNTSHSVLQWEVFDVGLLWHKVGCDSAVGPCAWGRDRAHKETCPENFPMLTLSCKEQHSWVVLMVSEEEEHISLCSLLASN